MAPCLGHFVVAVLFPPSVHLRGCKSGVRIDLERRERVGNRRGGDVRRLGVCRLRGLLLDLGFPSGRWHEPDRSSLPLLSAAKGPRKPPHPPPQNKTTTPKKPP